MSEISEPCKPEILKDTRMPTSSQASAVGPLHLNSQTGPMKDLFGQEVAHVNRLAQQENKQANQTSATYGQIGLGSSDSQNLAQSLGNKLTERLPSGGLMMPSWTWKVRATPALRRYCQLVVSALPIEETGFGLWPTPTACENNGDADKKELRRQKAKIKWGKRTGNGFGYSLAERVRMWPTPRALSSRGTGPSRTGNKTDLQTAVKLWPSPQASDHRDRGNLSNPSVQRRLQIGKQISLSMVVSPTSGQLNPRWVAWLMGYPPEWEDLRPLEMPSFHKSHKRS